MPARLPLTVGLVTPSFDKGGLEQVVLNLYRGYRARGCRVVVLVENNIAGAMLNRLDSPDHAVILNREEGLFLDALARWEIDVLHYHYASFGIALARDLGVHTLYTLHNVYTWLADEGFAHHARAVCQANRIVAVSDFVRSYFARRAGCPADMIDVIPNGVDPGWLVGAAPLPELGLPKDRFVFAMPASTHPVKHHALAIAAFERVAAGHPSARLLLIGNPGEAETEAYVRARIAASPAVARISRIDYIAHDAMPTFYREIADCVILPTLQEGCSNVALEAMAMDAQLILTDVGNAREAARMSPRVRVVPAAEAVERLSPERIAALSTDGATANLQPLVAAMEAAIVDPTPAATPEDLAQRRAEIGLDRMVEAYHRLFRETAPLAANPGTGYPWAPPAASRSNTPDALA
ncbi:MAG: glycosyltransferase family 4 protein [Pikeienuella sp.]